MEQAFYCDRLRDELGLDVIVPNADDRAIIHRIIYDELCVGNVRDDSRDEYRRIMAALVGDGAEGIILGCTEIMLLVGDGDASVPLFDTTSIHARSAAEYALA